MAKYGYCFIVWLEFFRSFCYYGVQGKCGLSLICLARMMLFFLFYTNLRWSLSSSVAMVHLHGVIFYSFAMVGVFFAERRKSFIVNIFGFVAVIGNSLIFSAVLVGDMAEQWEYLQLFKEVTVVTGVLLRSIGAGMIREVPMRIGEDMVATEEDQRKIRSRFYLGLFYAFSSGIALATILLPTLRMNIVWMGKNMCWPLPFGVAVICLILGLLIFNGGAISYRRTEHIPNNIKRAMQCIMTGDAYREADYRIGDYDDEFAEDAGQAGRVVVLFAPLPIFWALFEQLWTRWPHQGLRMDGLVNGTVPIEPDTMFLAIPVVNMCVLPFFEYIIFPLLANVVLCRTPKARIALGALLAIVAFILAGSTEIVVEGEKEFVTPTFQQGHAEVVFWNPTRCPTKFTFKGLPGHTDVELPAATAVRLSHIPCKNRISFTVVKVQGLIKNKKLCRRVFYPFVDHKLYIYEDKVSAYFIYPVVSFDKSKKNAKSIFPYPLAEELMLRDHVKGGLQIPVVGSLYRVFLNRTGPLPECRELHMQNPLRFSTRKRYLYANRHHRNFELYPQGKYYPTTCGKAMLADDPTVLLRKGGVYMLNPVQTLEEGSYRNMQVLEEPFKVSIMWQIPQYAIMALAQLLCPALLLDYSYRQVHRSMVPYLLFMWLFMAAVGNLIVCLEALCNFWARTFHLYIFYVVLMSIAFIALCVLLFLYEHLEPAVPEEEEQEEEE